MKHSNKYQRWITALTLAGSSLVCRAQTPSYIVDQFDSDAEVSYYQNQGWGTSAPSFSFNTTNATPVGNYPNNEGSGSLEWQSTWLLASGDQIMVTRNFNTITNTGDVLDLNNYTNISFDIQFQPDSATDGAGSYGTVEIDAIPQSDGWPSTTLNSYTSATTNGNGWIHVSLPIVNGAKLSLVTGIGFKIQQSQTGPALDGTTDFLLDNVILGGNSGQITPPTLSISKANTPPGLLIVAQGGGNQYNRAELEANDPNNGLNFSWIGAGTNPVTYSMTIVGYPDTNHSGFESEIFLVPNGGAEDTGIDYDAANVAQLAIFNNADGTATGSFQYKTNQAEGNSLFTGYGNLGSITTSNILGTWSLTFLNDTNVTISGPGGISTNVNFQDEAHAQIFANPLSVYFGNQQGGTTANIGQGSTYSQFSISGTPVTTPFTDVFTNDAGVISTTQWILDDPTAPNNIVIVQPGNSYWVSWTLPDTGFSLLSSPALGTNAVWNSLGLNVVDTTLANKTLVPQSSLSGTNQGYFLLGKPAQ